MTLVKRQAHQTIVNYLEAFLGYASVQVCYFPEF